MDVDDFGKDVHGSLPRTADDWADVLLSVVVVVMFCAFASAAVPSRKAPENTACMRT